MFDILDKNELTRKEVVYLVIKFLRKKRLLEEFCEEYKVYHRAIMCINNKTYDLKHTIERAVGNCRYLNEFFKDTNSAFLWRETRKGHAFWYKISEEWMNYVKGKRFLYLI
jgi:hypothetical protein